MDLISDAEGITGFIREVTVRVQQLNDLETVAVKATSASEMQRLAEMIVEEKLPIWSFLFINPRMAEMRNRAPLRVHGAHPAEGRVLLPESYIVTLTFRKEDSKSVSERLAEIVKICQAEILNQTIAHHEWENRFKVMLVKRLGPSLVPAEVVLPLSGLAGFMDEIEEKIARPVVKEGIVIRKGPGEQPEVVILGFIPSDRRRFSYHFVFSLSLSIANIAKRHGGRIYSTGLYFSKKAPEVLGFERMKSLREFKREIDPKNILNPGKVIDSRFISTTIGFAGALESFTRFFGNRVRTDIGVRPGKSIRRIPADVAWHAYSCSQCGFCVQECDQFYGRGWGRANPPGVNGTGFASTWRAGRSGAKRW